MDSAIHVPIRYRKMMEHSWLYASPGWRRHVSMSRISRQCTLKSGRARPDPTSTFVIAKRNAKGKNYIFVQNIHDLLDWAEKASPNTFAAQILYMPAVRTSPAAFVTIYGKAAEALKGYMPKENTIGLQDEV